MLARNGCLCSLSYKDWRLLIGKKERNTNEQKNKNDILKQVKMRFLYSYRMEKWILRTIGDRWRQHKSNLKSIYFDVNKSKEVNYINAPDGVIVDQWIALVDNWMTQKAQGTSKANRIHRAKKKSIPTTGTKSFARNREELRAKDPEKKYPHRVVLYIHTHQAKSEKNTNAHVDNLKELIVQQPDLVDTSQGKDAWKGDALSQILGEEKPGHVHGLGLVPNPDQFFEPTTSRRLKNINLTSLDAKSSEDVVSLRLQMEKFERRIQSQDATILELKQNTKTLEQRQTQQRCSDDPGDVPKDGFCMDMPNSKRKRVYGDHRTEQFSGFEQHDYTMEEQTDEVDCEDMQPLYKIRTEDKRKAANALDETFLQANRYSTTHKAKSKYIHDDIRLDKSKYTDAAAAKGEGLEPSSNFSNQDDSHHQKKQHGTKNLSTGNSMKVGTKLFLKSLKNQTKDVALATIVSCDPTQKVEGVQLGKEFWMVHVSIPIMDNEPLIRPYKSYRVIRDAQGVNIAWPSTFVEKINA